MSRVRKALITAGFGYAQSLLSLGLGFAVTPVYIATLGRDVWGLWLASGALLGYAALAELGIMTVLPWLVAEADGRRDDERLKAHLANAFVCAGLVAIAYLTVAALLWMIFPSVLKLDAAERERVFGPLVLLASLTAITFPFRVFSGLLAGLQDVGVAGGIAMLQGLGSVVASYAFVRAGWGLYGLAAGVGAPALAAALVATIRSSTAHARLLRGWPKPSPAGSRELWTGGLGAWLGGIGWQLASASDAVVLASLGHRTEIAALALTSRLGLTLMQLGWQLPDAALIGLAQLKGEANTDRVADVGASIVRLHAVIAGGVACVVLAVNPAFVRAWVGADLFGGSILNALLAFAVVAMSLAHGLIVPGAVLGHRAQAGMFTLANGVVHIALSVPLAHELGVRGVALATALSALLTTVPGGAFLLARATGRSLTWVLGTLLLPWAVRTAPLAALALGVGHWARVKPLGVALVAGFVIGVLYMIAMRPLYQKLPLPNRVRSLLERVGLLDRAPSV